jgi:hypothetical protein
VSFASIAAGYLVNISVTDSWYIFNNYSNPLNGYDIPGSLYNTLHLDAPVSDSELIVSGSSTSGGIKHSVSSFII